MSYSCSDFVDSIMQDLVERGLIKEDDLPDGDDTVSQQADLALAAITRLHEENARLKEAARVHQQVGKRTQTKNKAA